MKQDVLKHFAEFGRSWWQQIPTLQFRDGGFFVDDAPFESIKLIADMPALRTGWVRYDCDIAVQKIMGPVSENFQPPGREDLGNLDEALWEVEGEGRNRVPVDPWRETAELPVYNLDNRDKDFLLVCDNHCCRHADWERDGSSGMAALGFLCQVYAAHARFAPNALPIIELSSRVLFTHPTRGDISIPQISVVDWWKDPRPEWAK